MHNITLRKQDGFSPRNPLKGYDVLRNGEVVGALTTWGGAWEVFDAALVRVAKHTTIKAAVRVAGKVL